MKVLIADDDQVLMQLLMSGLKKRGIEPVAAFDAMQAVMVALKSVPDVVLLDINMPGGTGMEALKRIKGSAKTSAVPVIAMTGTATEEVRKSAIEMGAVECLEKPLDIDALAELLKRVAGEG
jgi:two-component system cell cycle response regulator DivK